MLDWSHTIVLYYEADQLCLLDSGTGTNLAIELLLLDSGSVTSHVDKFRLISKETEKGIYVAEVYTEQG